MNMLRDALNPVYHGLAMGLLALIFGALWAAYIATHHEQLHGGFEASEAAQKKVHMQADMSMNDMDMGHAHQAGEPSHEHAEASSPHAHGEGHKHGEMHQHSHSGSLATDAMQRLLRGHIHFMGIGILILVVLFVVASTTLKNHWKQVLAWTLGLGALMYPPAWILMGFRTVSMGPEGAEASVMWLFGPAVALLIGSLIAVFTVMFLEFTGLKKTALFSWAFESSSSNKAA